MLNSGRSAVSVRGLRVVRGGRVVLPSLDVEIRTGMVSALLGPSGSGKTTLMRAIVGVQQVAGGTVEVLGLPAGSPALRNRVAYVTQAPSVYGDLTVRENLRYFVDILGAPRSDIARVIDEVDLTTHADVLVNNLSDGQRSRTRRLAPVPVT